MVEVTEADAVLLRLLDIPCSATDLLIVATHREATAKAERDRIVTWLRDDARLTEIEARRILGNLTTLTQADTDDWAKLIAMKHGIADALEKQP